MGEMQGHPSDREPVMIAGHPVLFLPHFVPGIGPRVFVVNQHPDMNNYSTDDARLYASHLQIAANEADAMAKRAHRQKA